MAAVGRTLTPTLTPNPLYTAQALLWGAAAGDLSTTHRASQEPVVTQDEIASYLCQELKQLVTIGAALLRK